MNVYSCCSVNIRSPMVYYDYYEIIYIFNRFNYLNTYINELKSNKTVLQSAPFLQKV